MGSAYLKGYFLTGTLIALGLMASAFYQAENKGRIVIFFLAATTFIVPKIFPGSTVHLISFIARILVAAGCYVYVKWRNA